MKLIPLYCFEVHLILTQTFLKAYFLALQIYCYCYNFSFVKFESLDKDIDTFILLLDSEEVLDQTPPLALIR